MAASDEHGRFAEPSPKAQVPQLEPGQTIVGNGGEIHQIAGGAFPPMRTNRGVIVADDENSLKAGVRGPSLFRDFHLLEKIQHFDHERIPERVVHARGVGAHGYFELTEPLTGISRAKILNEVGVKTPVFVRFSTVAGNKGSTDLARDVRGFATKFYTSEGIWDLVANNIPVFFVQDALKFPDLVHSVKQEPDRDFPQAASAHDTFWDFVSLMPESTHMLFWTMSDRAIPRTFRHIEGFGVHSFRLINERGQGKFVKFHWRPKLGMQALIWDEALKLSGADPDFHRRDLWNSIQEGNFPEWEFGVQIFDDEFARKFDFDVLDPTKIIPEEILPLKIIGRMVLDRTVTNHFAETEQVAFCVSNMPPGIDMSNDPLLQGRAFSYQDTQLSRLGGPNFQMIPINQPRGCPFANFQRDGHMNMLLQKGRVAYQPNSLAAGVPRQDPTNGHHQFAEPVEEQTVRLRPESFADHYSQALQFWMSQTGPEQNHIISAFVFELSKVENVVIRQRMVNNLANVEMTIAHRVAKGLNLKTPIEPSPAKIPTRRDLPPSPALSLLQKQKPGVETFKIGVLVADGSDALIVQTIHSEGKKRGAVVKLVAPRVGGVDLSDGTALAADFQLQGGPSVLFDAVYVVLSADGAAQLSQDGAAVGWVHDAYIHLKTIGATSESQPLLKNGGAVEDPGVLVASDTANISKFYDTVAQGRNFDREPRVRPTF